MTGAEFWSNLLYIKFGGESSKETEPVVIKLRTTG